VDPHVARAELLGMGIILTQGCPIETIRCVRRRPERAEGTAAGDVTTVGTAWTMRGATAGEGRGSGPSRNGWETQRAVLPCGLTAHTGSLPSSGRRGWQIEVGAKVPHLLGRNVAVAETSFHRVREASHLRGGAADLVNHRSDRV
jgi:hypothetical protein